MADCNGILVIGEMTGDEIASTTLEALAAGRSLLASLPGEKLSIILAGASTAAAAQIAIAHGAEAVYTIDDPSLSEPAPEAIVAISEEAVRQASPRIVLGSKTLLGRDVMPRLAFRVGTALAQDCTALAIDGAKRLLATRPVYGGNAVATIACTSKISVAALRAKSIDAAEPDDSRVGLIVTLSVDLVAAVRVHSVDRVEQTAEGIRLEDAPVVVSGGRGLGGPEPFKELEKLAALLGGAVGASRAACDAGWVPSSYQVGLTGKTVTPELYIAVGISGASQHMAGCSNARTIVAINKDTGANIFKDARFGVAGDWQKVLPAFMEQLHELLG
jgi:electron transfer flavoprotein alpha subunit